MLNRFCGLQLKQAADEVRQHWNGWLELVTKAERWGEQHNDDPLLCIAIAWLSFEEGQNQRRYRVLLGERHKITEALAGSTVYSCNFVSVALVLHTLKAKAAAARIQLPARLTIAESDRVTASGSDGSRTTSKRPERASPRSTRSPRHEDFPAGSGRGGPNMARVAPSVFKSDTVSFLPR